MTEKKLKFLGIAGSLREKSFNRALLQTVTTLMPETVELEIFQGLGEIPLYNEDVEKRGDPEPVVAFKKAIREADVLLFSTPEYNYSVPGVLKNALDWASRPPGKSVLNDKLAGIIGASQSATGTARAQLALRQSFVFTETIAFLQPEVLIARAQEKFNDQGELKDEKSREVLKKYLKELVGWSQHMLALQRGSKQAAA